MNKRFGITLFLVLFLAVNSFAQSKKSLWTIDATKTNNYVGAPIANGK